MKIKSRSVAVIVNLELLASSKTFERIGRVLLFSISLVAVSKKTEKKDEKSEENKENSSENK